MADLLLPPIGLLVVAAAALHDWLGQTRLIGPAQFPTATARRLVVLIWHYSAVSWAACGLLIAASPWLVGEGARPWVVAACCLPLVFGAVGNGVATRGRHCGWKIFAGLVLAAMAAAVG